MFDDVYLEDIETVVPYAETPKLVFKLKATCYSDECYYAVRANVKDGHRSDCGIEKQVPRHTMFCPDCEYALFWERYAA